MPKPHTEGDYGKPIDPGYNTFYTTSAKVNYFQANRIEGKSGYLHYVPSDNVVEQRLEKMWYENINKDIAEKRTQEEIRQSIHDWKNAKSRIEGEIQRKKEHMIEGSNFNTCFGTRAYTAQPGVRDKDYDFNQNPLERDDGSSMMSDSELAEESEAESSDASDKVPRHVRIQQLINKRRCKTAGA